MTILATVVLLGVLIFVHELGHYWAAKAVDIEVQRFSIGFGPRLFGFTRGETEYIISAIPLGGYVKMGGMDDEVMEQIEGGGEEGAPPRQPSDRDFDAKPIWARTLVISAGVIMNMLFAFGTYTFLAVRYGVQDPSSTRIGMVQETSLPPGTEALADVEPGSRVLSMGGAPVEDWGDVQDGFYRSGPGPLTIEFGAPTRIVEIRVPVTQEERVQLVSAISIWREAGVGYTNPGSPAARAGLEEGDRIVAVDGEPTLNWWMFVSQVEDRPGERVTLTIDRGGREITRAVTMDSVDREMPDGSVIQVGQAGIGPPALEMNYERVPLMSAFKTGYDETLFITGVIVGFLRDLVTLNVSPRSVGSIVTIGEATGQAAAAGFDVYLRFMALFSINLAVLNLLPIPVLDGGHLVFLAIEAIRGGRPLSVEQRLRWSNVGFIMIVGIMLWALSNDFMRLFGL
jgi:regulator of sigma E protease